DDNDDNAAFIDNAFDYPLAHFLALFKQVEDKVDEAMQKKKYAETIGIARKAINIAIEKDDLN
ncbi:13500_t:CDS:2, partial [Gigaspora rosea]